MYYLDNTYLNKAVDYVYKRALKHYKSIMSKLVRNALAEILATVIIVLMFITYAEDLNLGMFISKFKVVLSIVIAISCAITFFKTVVSPQKELKTLKKSCKPYIKTDKIKFIHNYPLYAGSFVTDEEQNELLIKAQSLSNFIELSDKELLEFSYEEDGKYLIVKYTDGSNNNCEVCINNITREYEFNYTEKNVLAVDWDASFILKLYGKIYKFAAKTPKL